MRVFAGNHYFSFRSVQIGKAHETINDEKRANLDKMNERERARRTVETGKHKTARNERDKAS